MSWDREDFQTLKRSQSGDRAAAAASRLTPHMQAALRAEAVTREPHWDAFLTYLENAIAELKARAVQHEAAQLDPRVVDAEQIMSAKIQAAQCNAMVGALEAVLQLPRDLRDEGRKILSILERLDG